MSEFNTLQSMGLTDIESISHYNLSSKDNQDILKVYFSRPEGSPLPDSSSFCFDINKVVAADSEAAAQQKNHAGSDPVLLAAVEELNALSKQLGNRDRREMILSELDRLEQTMQAKIQELRDDLNRFA